MNTQFRYLSILLFSLFILLHGCVKDKEQKKKPNVILILADDIGFEGLSINGSLSYKTPFLDELASNGVNFTNAISQPLCTPSRVKIMTGKYNYKNYDYFTHLNINEKTFAHLFKENGYKTAVVGKWQLNGLRIGDVDREVAEDNTRPYEFGFDEYSLWQLTKPKQYGERFANPLIEQNGNFLPRNENSYGPDIVSDYAVEFIKRNKDNPFFIYYPMALVHDPFLPTPDSDDWNDLEKRNKGNKPIYFSDMLTYMDKIVGRISNTLDKNKLDNTILIFIGDNGTDTKVVTLNKGVEIRGAKGSTIKYASNVPMIVNWKSQIKQGFNSDAMIDFTDFYATFEDILNLDYQQSYGKSILPLMTNNNYNERDVLITYYDPIWGSGGLGRGCLLYTSDAADE